MVSIPQMLMETNKISLTIKEYRISTSTLNAKAQLYLKKELEPEEETGYFTDSCF